MSSVSFLILFKPSLKPFLFVLFWSVHPNSLLFNSLCQFSVSLLFCQLFVLLVLVTWGQVSPFVSQAGPKLKSVCLHLLKAVVSTLCHHTQLWLVSSGVKLGHWFGIHFLFNVSIYSYKYLFEYSFSTSHNFGVFCFHFHLSLNIFKFYL